MFYRIETFGGIRYLSQDQVESIKPLGQKFLFRLREKGFTYNVLVNKGYELITEIEVANEIAGFLPRPRKLA